jgi:hypothetical protein
MTITEFVEGDGRFLWGVLWGLCNGNHSKGGKCNGLHEPYKHCIKVSYGK